MQKIVNLLNGSEDEFSKFITKKWYVIDSKSNGSYSHHDPIKFLTKSIESSLCDYSDAHILINGNTFVTRTQRNYSKKSATFCVLTTAAIGADANATGANSATFKISDAKLYVPIVTSSTEDNAILA